MILQKQLINTDSVYENMYLQEAEFSLLPRFKKRTELQDLYDAIDEADEILQSTTGESLDSSLGHKIGGTILRFYDIFYNACNLISVPFCITIVYIPTYLICRLVEWGIQTGEEMIAEDYCRKVEKQITRCMSRVKDPKEKAALQKQIDAVRDARKRLR